MQARPVPNTRFVTQSMQIGRIPHVEHRYIRRQSMSADDRIGEEILIDVGVTRIQ